MGGKLVKISRKRHTAKYEGESSQTSGTTEQTAVLSAMNEYPRTHSGPVSSVSSLQNGGLCITGGSDKVVSAFDIASGKQTIKWTGHTAEVVKVCSSSDDQHALVFSSSRDKTIKCWKLSSPATPYQSMQGHKLVAPALSYSKDSQQLFSGSRDNSVCLWDVTTGTCIANKDLPRNIATSVQWFHNGAAVVQTSEDKILKIWDSRSMDVVSNFPLKQYFQTCCAVSGDDQSLVTGSTGFNGKGSQIIVWDIRQERALAEFNGHQARVTGCIFLKSNHQNPSDQLIGSVSCDSTLRIWNQTQGDCIGHVTVDGAMEITGMSQLQQRKIAVSTVDRGICLYDISHPSLPCLVSSF